MPLAEQDRSQWDTELIAEGVAIVQAALAQDRLGEYQAQAAIAALHADAPRFEDTDWVQIVEWYDELLRFADTPIIRLNRAVAVGEADGAPAGLAALADVDENIPRRDAVAAHLHERNGDLELAARLYAAAARNAPNLAERDHQTRQAARLNQLLHQQVMTRARRPNIGAVAQAASRSAWRRPRSGALAPPHLHGDASPTASHPPGPIPERLLACAVGARCRVLLMESSQALDRKSVGEADECCPQPSVDERHLPVHEPRTDDIRGVGQPVQRFEDRVTRRVTPPTSANRSACDHLGNVRNRSASGLEEHSLLRQHFDRLHRRASCPAPARMQRLGAKARC